MKKLINHLTQWIRDMVFSAELKGVVLGMSGGIDSSVLAIICYRAFPDNMLGVHMPCYSDEQDSEHVQQIADLFAIPIKTVVLNNVFDAAISVLPNNLENPTINRLAQANLKARLRMSILYYFANQLDYLVVGSSNRSELSIGYFTKYGDGGVDLLPLGNLVKKQIWELAHSLGVPNEIIEKPPSAGLWPGQTDELEMGISYKDLDHYLINGSINDKIKQKIEVLQSSSKHKRLPPPIANLHHLLNDR